MSAAILKGVGQSFLSRQTAKRGCYSPSDVTVSTWIEQNGQVGQASSLPAAGLDKMSVPPASKIGRRVCVSDGVRATLTLLDERQRLRRVNPSPGSDILGTGNCGIPILEVLMQAPGVYPHSLLDRCWRRSRNGVCPRHPIVSRS